jgi:hypothetical protein|tara:strand:- start:224 stop:1102 length:879 start_codon:yes stop_codon:yes gene_type:complete
MTKTPIAARVGFKQWQDMGDIFYSKRDKLNFLSALNSVVNESLSLVIVSETPALLNYYSRMLVARLRKVKGINLGVFLPTTTDGLLKKFNDILADMTLEEAKEQPTGDASLNVMVIHDANSVADEQWVLLSRLMADFPGVNVRLVLFLDERLVGECDSLIGRLGKDLYRWAVSSPTMEQARELLLAGEENGYFSEAQALLKKIDMDVGSVKREEYEVSPRAEIISQIVGQVDSASRTAPTMLGVEAKMTINDEPPKRIRAWGLLIIGSVLFTAWAVALALGVEIMPGLFSGI